MTTEHDIRRLEETARAAGRGTLSEVGKKTGNGETPKSQVVDWNNPEHIVNLLRQRGSDLVAAGRDGTLTLADIGEAMAALMFVTAQGIERGQQRVQPAVATPRIIRG